MNEYLLLKLLHLLAFVYWLGGDLGTFFSSRFVADSTLSPAQRMTALKIMLGCDQGPKLCMPLIFGIGYSMATQVGFMTAPGWLGILVWAITLAWFANVNYLYFTNNARAKALIGQVDLWFRSAVVLVLTAVGFGGLAGSLPIHADWLAVKLLVFAALVACGIYIRIGLKPFVAAFGMLMTQGTSPTVESQLSGALARVRPAVYLIWLGLILNAALGLHLITI